MLEALALSRLRVVEGDRVATLSRFLPAIYLAFNLEGATPSLDVTKLIERAIELDNAAFVSDGGGGGPQ